MLNGLRDRIKSDPRVRSKYEWLARDYHGLRLSAHSLNDLMCKPLEGADPEQQSSIARMAQRALEFLVHFEAVQKRSHDHLMLSDCEGVLDTK